MRKISILTAICLSFMAVAAFINVRTVRAEVSAVAVASFKLVNDTDNDVEVHTGSGFVEINKTSSTSISCEAGKEIRLEKNGKKGAVLFVVDDSMCGKVVKLSKYL